jgi:hypothetical protein
MNYPEDRLYLRVLVLCQTLKDCLTSNLEAYAYLRTIERVINPSVDIDFIKRTEKHLLSNEFINKNCFKDSDRENLIQAIREWKLNQLV